MILNPSLFLETFATSTDFIVKFFHMLFVYICRVSHEYVKKFKCYSHCNPHYRNL
jgi:hypothetical protein